MVRGKVVGDEDRKVVVRHEMTCGHAAGRSCSTLKDNVSI